MNVVDKALATQIANIEKKTGKSLAELVKTGWRPKRTIKFALWDGEEAGLGMGRQRPVERVDAGGARRHVGAGVGVGVGMGVGVTLLLSSSQAAPSITTERATARLVDARFSFMRPPDGKPHPRVVDSSRALDLPSVVPAECTRARNQAASRRHCRSQGDRPSPSLRSRLQDQCRDVDAPAPEARDLS
jgi:hypothetical protein